MRQNNPKRNIYYPYNEKFCKIGFYKFREGKPVLGKVFILDKNLIRIVGDYIDTSIDVSEIKFITTKIDEDRNG